MTVRRTLRFALLAAACTSCTGSSVDTPTSKAQSRTGSQPSAPVVVTLLYTSDEHGWLLPYDEGNRTWGGAASVLGAWIAKEGHCPGPAPHGSIAPPPSAACADPSTLALSGGDNYTGPAISSYFGGAPMAETFARMGYAASAFGNHEFDFSREQFEKNRDASHMKYLAANARGGTGPAIDLPKFAVFDRRGVRIAVVGLATDTTLATAMASRFQGMTFAPEEPALDEAIKAAWSTHPDTVVVIAHECVDKLAPMLTRHPEWKLAFFGAAHCHKVVQDVIGGVPIVSPGWRFARYVRVPIAIDRSRPEGDRVVHVAAELVDTSRPLGTEPNPLDAPLVALAKSYGKRLDAALGETIGFSEKGLAKDSREIGQWIANAWRTELQADAAIVNMGGIRQALPKGVVTKATVWSIMPFDNRLVVCKLRGSDLVADVRMADMITSGVNLKGADFVFANGKVIVPDQLYKVVTIDFLYLGGAHARFEKQDPVAVDTGIDWREPVVAWTQHLQSSPAAPLERQIALGGVVSP